MLLTIATPDTSTTPPGSPPPNAINAMQNGAAAHGSTAPALPNGSSILEALAKLANQKNVAAPSNPAGAASALPPYAMPPAAAPPQPASSSVPPAQPAMSYPPAQPPVNMSNMPFSLAPAQGQNPMPAAAPAPSYGGQWPGQPAAPAPAPQPLDSNTQLALLKALLDQGVPPDQIGPLLQSLTAGAAAGGAMPPAQPPASATPLPYAAAQQPWQTQAPQAAPAPNPRDRFRDKSPPRFGQRSRSRSPGWGNRGSPRGRDRGDNNGRRGDEYRQRSPPGRRGNRSPGSAGALPHVDRWVDFDPTLPQGSIRVYSRTLFVGGVT